MTRNSGSSPAYGQFLDPADTVNSMAKTAAAIISVANQPGTLSLVVMTNCPIISVRTAINIITTMIGTEMTPLMTALLHNALIGSLLSMVDGWNGALCKALHNDP